ncbi:MAG: response regulator [Anaerolineales bacterium]|nr:response regulator [Anaerolineales bacterium]MCB8952544.1 response regulator [Ardenticatenales bacterium]
MKTVLHIEDDPRNLLLIHRILEPHPYRLLDAGTGEQGLEIASREQPDLILIDLGLPDIDGQTVILLLRELPHLAHVPIVAITAWPRDTALAMAERYGCDGCILKPINVREFPTQIAAYIQS